MINPVSPGRDGQPAWGMVEGTVWPCPPLLRGCTSSSLGSHSQFNPLCTGPAGPGGAAPELRKRGRAAAPPPDDKRMLRFSQLRGRPPAPEGSSWDPAGR